MPDIEADGYITEHVTSEYPCVTRQLLDKGTVRFGKFPENNDGRSTCYWCNGPTEKLQGFTESYDFCRKCKR